MVANCILKGVMSRRICGYAYAEVPIYNHSISDKPGECPIRMGLGKCPIKKPIVYVFASRDRREWKLKRGN